MVPIVEKDKEKTAFVSPRGQFEFCVMPFGLCNAPSTYQKIIDLALRYAPHSLPYIDDTLTFSDTFNLHLADLRTVLTCYRDSNLQLRRDKCRFGYTEVEFLGYVLTKDGYKPLSSNVLRIQQQARTTNVKQLTLKIGIWIHGIKSMGRHYTTLGFFSRYYY